LEHDINALHLQGVRLTAQSCKKTDLRTNGLQYPPLTDIFGSAHGTRLPPYIPFATLSISVAWAVE